MCKVHGKVVVVVLSPLVGYLDKARFLLGWFG